MVTANLREAEPARGGRARLLARAGARCLYYLFGGMVVRFVCDPCARVHPRVSRVCPGSVRETRDLTTPTPSASAPRSPGDPTGYQDHILDLFGIRVKYMQNVKIHVFSSNVTEHLRYI
jgi:hypothetical protein